MKLGALAFLVILSSSQIGCEEERPIFTTGNPPMAPLGEKVVGKSAGASSRGEAMEQEPGEADVLRIGRAIAVVVR